ncbi:LPS export ABC transporter periplasmic protein LptC [Ramlibacter sp. PS4R-6]|uniref:LPS export ABC transporter periplasmic protein LptC n=1 Tax=Ramlibacter sp. PS4R-6 TaxID=3133438 RepID=UPI0030AABD38
MIVGGFIQGQPSGRMFRAGWERISVYLPVILMGLIALLTYWLARNTPTLGPEQTKAAATHDPDQFMRRFSVKSFDASGRLKTELHGAEARHYPDTDTTEIDQPRLRSINERGAVTVATAKAAISNADGSEVQLMGEAVVTRAAYTDATGRAQPRVEIRSEYLHVFVNTERITSNKPVEILRGDDRLAGEGMAFDNVSQQLDMQGRVRAQIQPR